MCLLKCLIPIGPVNCLIIPLQYPILWILSHNTALLSNHALYAHKWTSCHIGPLIAFPYSEIFRIPFSFFPLEILLILAPPFLPSIIQSPNNFISFSATRGSHIGLSDLNWSTKYDHFACLPHPTRSFSCGATQPSHSNLGHLCKTTHGLEHWW